MQSIVARRSVPRIPSSPIRVVIVDDFALIRQGISVVLRKDSDIRVVGEAEDGESGVAMVRELKPDVVLMDLNMPGMGGIAATSIIVRESPTTVVVALSGSTGPDSVRGMINAGAVGFLSKDSEPDELRQAIRGAAMGQVQLGPLAIAQLMRDLLEPETELLSNRELDVLQLVAVGKTNQAIGNALFISVKTVKAHVSNILAKLGVESRTQAALLAVEQGLIAPVSDLLATPV